MKSCTKCQRVFPNDAGYCPIDGTRLSSTSTVPIAVSEDARIGTRLRGRYELRRVVADGGMGRVYEGVDKQTDTRVAVKVLHDDVANDSVALERFKRESAMSSKLPHDFIVGVVDFQHDETLDAWFLVMDFLDGEELRYVLKRNRTLPPERLLRVVSQVAIALDEAHRLHFVHRDLKPDNLFLCGTRDGDVVKILDFGSVKDRNKDAKKLTALGTTIGSPFYMAPEQAQALDTLDGRADVFALAAITYECAVGRVPFEGTNATAILLGILSKEPTPPSVRAREQGVDLPSSIDRVIARALAKDPNARTATAGAFADALGGAFSLPGDHRQWALTTQTELEHALREARSRPALPSPAVVDVERDPFLERTPRAQEIPPPPPIDAVLDDVPQGVPSRTPAWVLPTVVGIAALLIGAAATVLLYVAR